MRALGIAAGVLTGVALVAYPMFVFWAFTHWEPRYASLALLAVLAPVALMRLRALTKGNAAVPDPCSGDDTARRSPGQQVKALAVIPLVAFTAFALGAVLNNAGFVLAAPVAINVVLLGAFGSTLRRGSEPMIERFARLTVHDLQPGEQRWCRGWTVVWCAFFAMNASTAAALALWAPLSWWTVYNGLIAYLLMGVLFAAEYVPRKRKFGRLGGHPLDRVLAKLITPGHPH